jgi:hypothetical protein
MSLGGILFLVVAVLLLFGFIYLIAISARSWGVLHTILLCVLFIESWTFLYFSAGVHSERLKWLQQATTQRREADTLQTKVRELAWVGSSAPGAPGESLLTVSGDLRRLTYDRGRVWRNVTKLQTQGNQVRLRLGSAASAPAAGTDALDPDAAPAAPAAAAAVGSESLPVAMVVYAFSAREVEIPLITDLANSNEVVRNRHSPPKIPDRFIGEFTVAESNAGELLLRSTRPLAPEQQQLMQAEDETEWILYELLPIDSHTAFAQLESQPTEDEIFGHMSPEALEELFASVPDTDSRRQRLIDSYARDGGPANQDDPPLSVWVRVEMLKDHTVDVDSQEEANATVGGFFDSSGRAVDVRLKRAEGGQVVVEQGKQIVVDQVTAQDLIDRQIAKLISRIYVRPLNAYEKAFSHLVVRRDEVDKRTLVYQREMAVLQEANQLGQAMISERQVENQRLTADLNQTGRERDFISQQASSMVDRLQQARSQAAQLFRDLQSEHDRRLQAAAQ